MTSILRALRRVAFVLHLTKSTYTPARTPRPQRHPAPGMLRGPRLAAAVRRRSAARRTRPDKPPAAPTGVLRGARGLALAAITVLVAAASLVSFAESFRALYEWATRHEIHGLWASVWPLQVDVFIAVGELALFVALADGWSRRSRIGAWLVTLGGLGVSVAGNVGHVTSHVLADRATAAVPPLAAASALAVGLGVLKRVVAAHPERASAVYGATSVQAAPAPLLDAVPADVIEAAKASMRATVAAGNPLSQNQLAERFSLTRAQAAKVRREVLAASNGHAPEGGE